MTAIKPIKKLLIANRGEIACRVIQTAKAMGLETAVVSSEPDANSLASTMADQTLVIGPAEASLSYLNQDKVIAAAKAWGADAIHPGYGFLSENADFARRLETENMIFVGPPASAMESMASKSEAKRLMEQAGVPLLKGYHGEDQSDATLKGAADDIGYPVMLKAAAGGGGKGMRIVTSAADFQETLDGARREADKAFGDTTMLVEKYLAAPRHIEVQIFFDKHGQGVYLFDRDCSIQRRHQKVIEEAPAPGLSNELRRTMGEAALAAGSAIGYAGAGTVEFLLDTDGSFYFMEMNTRLQVEHPVTEMVTGQDLVSWQIQVAEGRPLPCHQDELQVSGHSLEVRLYAEEPENEFLPATGTIQTLQWPQSADWLRVETGVRAGDEVTPWYDPMIAKLVTWGHDREQATSRMIRSLEQSLISGLNTNRDFLLRTLQQPAFVNDQPDTGFIPRHQQVLLATDKEEQCLALAAATLFTDTASSSAFSGWRLLQKKEWYSCWMLQGEHYTVALSAANGSALTVSINGERRELASFEQQDSTVVLGGKVFHVCPSGDQLAVISHSLTVTLSKPDYAVAEVDEQDLTAPMNGRVVAVMVADGQSVVEGDPLVILEAMKMEQTIRAPHDGVIEKILHHSGSLVEEGTTLLSFQEEPA